MRMTNDQRGRRLLGLVLLGLGAVSLFLVAWKSHSSDRASSTTEGGVTQAVGPATSKLTVRVLLEGGVSAPGSVSWTAAPFPPITSFALDPGQERSSSGNHPQMLLHDGVAQIEVPADHWTWLRATGRTRDGQVRRVYRRMAPFSGERELVVSLDGRARALHVFALDSDESGRASNTEIDLFAVDIRRGRPARKLRTRRTDEWGYVCFADLEPGLFLVCASTTNPDDPAPHTALVVLPSDLPMMEIPVTLVVPKKVDHIVAFTD